MTRYGLGAYHHAIKDAITNVPSSLPMDDPSGGNPVVGSEVGSLGRLSEPITLGKYQLIKKIAAGGMAEIFIAKVSGLPGFEKVVVVKRILPQLASNREFIQMFLDEARIAATLQHPNIVQMYDIGAIDGNYFISMEYLHGEDARALMRTLKRTGDWLPLEQSLHIVTGVASGLHYAHDKVGFDGHPLGIVHRDVTPQNIIVTYDGAVKVVDFGIAKASNRYNETRYGTLKGKIPYMSPEQCKSEPLDRRSDIYSIGILLYELTTARRLYRGSSDFEILKQIVERPVLPPSSFIPDYPKDLEGIVMKALAKRREERYQSAQELQADLEAFSRENRLVVSPIAMSAFMSRVFGAKLEAWRDAVAQGRDPTAHIDEREGGEDSVGEVLHGFDDLEGEAAGTRATTTDTPGHRGLGKTVRTVRRRLWLGVGVTAVVAVAVVLALTLGRGGGEEAAPALAAAGDSAPPGEPAPPPAAVLGNAIIETAPAGASVLVDEKPWPHQAPTVIDSLQPGPHVATLSREGYQERKVAFEVTAGQSTRLLIELEPLEAVASDDPPPEPPRGRTSERRPDRRTPPGKPGREDKPEIKRPPPGEVTPVGNGELRVASTPSCEVIVDGRSRGSTPLAGLELPAGKHRVQLVNSRYGIDESYTIEIKVAEVTKKKYTFPIEP